MLRVPHFLESFGVGAGGIEKTHRNLKGLINEYYFKGTIYGKREH
jgi:hypothetical protein